MYIMSLNSKKEKQRFYTCKPDRSACEPDTCVGGLRSLDEWLGEVSNQITKVIYLLCEPDPPVRGLSWGLSSLGSGLRVRVDDTRRCIKGNLA